MHTFAKKITRALLALVVALGGLALTGSLASAAPVTFNLCAAPGTLMPLPVTAPGITVPIWGFSSCDTSPGPSLPGPVLVVNEGDEVTIQLTSALPAGHTASFELAGLPVDSNCTPALGAVCYHFFATRPGTFVYQSPGDAGRQMAMGLYGALIVRPTGFPTVPGQAYGAVTTAFAVEATLVLSQVDPNFNNCSTDPNSPCLSDPNNFDMNNYLATYWLINGKAYPDTAPGITATAGQRVLLRYVNAGYDNTSMMLLGMHEQVLARDAYLLYNQFTANTETLPAGGTEDAIATMPSFATTGSGVTFPLFNRNLHVTNGSTATSDYATPGGMLIFIHP